VNRSPPILMSVIKPTSGIYQGILVSLDTGAPGLGLFNSDGPTAVVSLTVSSDRITRVDLIRALGKLLRLGARPHRVALRVGDDVFCRLHNRLA
jgi:hypothetical protein